MCNRSNLDFLDTFYALKLKFGMLFTPRPKTSALSSVAPGSCPGVGLGVKMYNRLDFT